MNSSRVIAWVRVEIAVGYSVDRMFLFLDEYSSMEFPWEHSGLVELSYLYSHVATNIHYTQFNPSKR